MVRAANDADPPKDSVGREHFNALYHTAEDPWNLGSAWYERRKYGITIAALPRERYRHALEPGCSIGELTRLLALRCDQVLAFDFAAVAVDRAQRALSGFPHVQVELRTLPKGLPSGRFDLIVASEVLYYLSRSDLIRTLDGFAELLEPDGDLLAVHHRAADDCYGYDGHNVHAALAARPEFRALASYDDDDFAIRVLRRIR